ncbi:Hypothetical predicted protein [Pelobates cultripes]|uniref:Uncharacterized protein n=1 Tax=Pelobates cultripes TaxID=61616 RepID=A0AAD1WGX9_PELCU|nr:Hypothetical predicted protein [Pelobates cultripes]
MADATCIQNCHTDKHSIMDKLEAILDAFWVRIASKERHTKVCKPIKRPAHTHRNRIGPRLMGPKSWRQRRRSHLLKHKQARSSHTVTLARIGPQAHPRPCMKRRPEQQPITSKLHSQLRSYPTPWRAPKHQTENTLTRNVHAGSCGDEQMRQQLEHTALLMTEPQQDFQTIPTPFNALGIG